MPSLSINSKELEVQPKENIVQAARRAGVEIPHYCWHHELSVVASCRMCLVEAGTKKEDGTVQMLPRLVPACQTPATPNTVIITDSPKVKAAQAQSLEYLLLNHPLDCSICDQAGECYLQDYTYKFGKVESRLQEPKVQRQDKYHIGDQIALFTDRCVMCTRCVRFTREFSGTSELMVTNRGSVEEIDVLPDQPCNNKLAGNVVDLCPVGALCSKDFLYKKRVWWLTSSDSVCHGCSTGCSISIDQNENKVYRLRPRENHLAQGSFMCDDGRFGWKYIHSEQRLKAPRIGRLTSQNKISSAPVAVSQAMNQSVQLQNQTQKSNLAVLEMPRAETELSFQDPWPAALKEVRQLLQNMGKQRGEKILAVFSPFMTCEEAYLLADFLHGISPQIVMGMGPIPVVGEDDCYPKDYKGNSPSIEKTRFTIRAEKCPNRLGVETILGHYRPGFPNSHAWEEQLAQNAFDAAFVVGGYPELNSPNTTWLSVETMQKLQALPALVVLDHQQSPLSDVADVLLAGATFAEKDGSVINHAGLAQRIFAVLKCSDDARPDGRILMELANRTGLFHGASLRAEMANKIPAFALFGDGELGEQGRRILGL